MRPLHDVDRHHIQRTRHVSRRHTESFWPVEQSSPAHGLVSKKRTLVCFRNEPNLCEVAKVPCAPGPSDFGLEVPGLHLGLHFQGVLQQEHLPHPSLRLHLHHVHRNFHQPMLMHMPCRPSNHHHMPHHHTPCLPTVASTRPLLFCLLICMLSCRVISARWTAVNMSWTMTVNLHRRPCKSLSSG